MNQDHLPLDGHSIPLCSLPSKPDYVICLLKMHQWHSKAWNLKYTLFKLSEIWPLPTFSGLITFHIQWNCHVLSHPWAHAFPSDLTSRMPWRTPSYPNNPCFLDNFWTDTFLNPLMRSPSCHLPHSNMYFLFTALMKLYCKWLVNCLLPSLDGMQTAPKPGREQVLSTCEHIHET